MVTVTVIIADGQAPAIEEFKEHAEAEDFIDLCEGDIKAELIREYRVARS